MSTPAGKGKAAKPSHARVERKLAEARKAKMQKLGFLGGVLVLAVIVAGVLIYISRDNSSEDVSDVVAAAPFDTSIPSDGRILGNPDAPVTLVEYADYQCPFCGAFSKEIMPQVINDFVKTGKIKIEFKDLPFLDSAQGYGESDMAAEAAACAADQGKFWQMHDTIFANQNGENQGAYSKDRLKKMAELAGLDTGKFNTCFDDRAHKDDVKAMQDEAVAAGVTSTPTLMINGTKITYTGRYSDLKASLEEILAA